MPSSSVERQLTLVANVFSGEYGTSIDELRHRIPGYRALDDASFEAELRTDLEDLLRRGIPVRVLRRHDGAELLTLEAGSGAPDGPIVPGEPPGAHPAADSRRRSAWHEAPWLPIIVILLLLAAGVGAALDERTENPATEDHSRDAAPSLPAITNAPPSPTVTTVRKDCAKPPTEERAPGARAGGTAAVIVDQDGNLCPSG